MRSSGEIVERTRVVSAFPVSSHYPRLEEPTQPQIRRYWRLNSDVEVDLDQIPMRMSNTELDLSVRSRIVRVSENTHTVHTLAPSQNPITSDRVSREPNLDRRNNKSRKGRAVSTETNADRPSNELTVNDNMYPNLADGLS